MTLRSLTAGKKEVAPALASAPRTAPVRLGRRTKALIPTLKSGMIAVIDHSDMDAVAAEGLVGAKPLAVLNNQPCITGRYPNKGPGVLLKAEIPLYEVPSEVDLFALLADDEVVQLSGNLLLRADGTRIAELLPLTLEGVNTRLEAARANLDAELCRFAENTLSYLQSEDERALLLGNIALPEIATSLAGRPVLVVVRGEGYERDLDRLGPYIREQKPVIIAVDGAADALLERGVCPQLLLGDMDSVSDAALRCGAELIVHAYSDGRAPGAERVERLGLTAHRFPIAGTSEDAALLLAYERDAEVIVAVGTHTNLEDFLDKGRGGMASTFLVRLKVGKRLVDARGVSHLYTSRTRSGPLLVFLALSALFPVCIFLFATPQGQVAWRSFLLWLRLR